MNRISKGLFALGVALALLLTGCGQPAQSDDADAQPVNEAVEDYLSTITPETAEASGICGADLRWYYQDHVLVIEGSGPMTDYAEYNGDRAFHEATKYMQCFYTTAPWSGESRLNEQIQWVIVGEGVTTIGDYAFHNFMSLNRLELPSTLTEIGDYAVNATPQLRTLRVPASVQTIGRIQQLCFDVVMEGPPPAFTDRGTPVDYPAWYVYDRSSWFSTFEDRPFKVYYSDDGYDALAQESQRKFEEVKQQAIAQGWNPVDEDLYWMGSIQWVKQEQA